ncbi:MAG: SDR family oxidoreductase [Candidatus Promineifilaceae bacterium]|nr:SDR family oxidoreductase [Candidatus Promineifilaceae bacterium]
MNNLSGNLDGKTVFVAGGAGNIGGIAVRGCLRAGARVVTASRKASRLDRLRRFIDADGLNQSRLITLEGELGDPAGARALGEAVHARVGTPDAVIASLGGGMESQPLLTMSLDTWYQALDNNLTSHLLAAQTFLPAMVERGSGVYIAISGYGAYVAWPGGAPISIAAAGVIGLGRSLAAENKDSGVRIATMVLATGPDLWQEFAQTPGAFRGDDVGDFLAWLVSDAAAGVEPPVLHYVTDWKKANAMRAVT